MKHFPIHKLTLPILFSVLFNNLCFAQILNEEVVFIDACSQRKIKAEYKVAKYEQNGRIVQYSVKRGKRIMERVFITYKKNDTIKIDRVGLSKSLDNKKAYFNCDTLCDGLVKDYYENGVIRLDGSFEKGTPVEIKIFEENGVIVSHETYYENSFLPKKTLFFDINGNPNGYATYQQNGEKVIVKNYDEKNQVISVNEYSIDDYK